MRRFLASLRLIASSLVATSVALSMSPLIARADFLRRGGSTYLSGKGSTLIAITQQTHGVFILAGPPTPVQEFDLANLQQDNTQHLFLRFDPQVRRYTEIMIGNTRYPVAGSFTVKLDSGRVSVIVDNDNPSATAYLAVVDEDSLPKSKDNNDKVPSILGILGGKDVVANYSGDAAVALLKPPSQEMHGIAPYSHNGTELVVEGKPVGSRPVGISASYRKNPCLNSEGVVYLTDSELKRLRSLGKDKAPPVLEAIIRKNSSKNYFESLMPLRVTDSIIALDYAKGVAKIIQPLSSKDKGSFSVDVTICIVETISL